MALRFLPVLALGLLAQDAAPITIDEKAGRISFGAKVGKTDVYAQLEGQIEYALVMPGGKEYESCFVAPVDPVKLYEGLKKIGVQPGRPADETTPPAGGKFRISVEWKDGDAARKEPVEAFIWDAETQAPMAAGSWIFTGSKQGFVPEIEDMGLLVQSSKNLVGLYSGDATTLATPEAAKPSGHRYKIHKKLLPKEGTAVTILFEAVR